MFKGNKSQYTPTNESKYLGNSKNIICRSSWERHFCYFLDTNTNVDKWSSEEFVIRYKSPIDHKIHRYFIDFAIYTNDKISLIEIKPFAQTQPPKKPKRMTEKSKNTFLYQTKTYVINQAKWAAAKKVAERINGTFNIYTEHELRKLGIKIY